MWLNKCTTLNKSEGQPGFCMHDSYSPVNQNWKEMSIKVLLPAGKKRTDIFIVYIQEKHIVGKISTFLKYQIFQVHSKNYLADRVIYYLGV